MKKYLVSFAAGVVASIGYIVSVNVNSLFYDFMPPSVSASLSVIVLLFFVMPSVACLAVEVLFERLYTAYIEPEQRYFYLPFIVGLATGIVGMFLWLEHSGLDPASDEYFGNVVIICYSVIAWVIVLVCVGLFKLIHFLITRKKADNSDRCFDVMEDKQNECNKAIF